MPFRYLKFLLLIGVLLMTAVGVNAQTSVTMQDEPVPLDLVIDDFESGIPLLQDEDGSSVGYVPWGNERENVVLSARQVIVNSPFTLPIITDTANTVLALNYDIGGWGGFLHAFTDGENWISADWTAYNAFSFWLYGNNTGGRLQIEIMDNRNPRLGGDTAERYIYYFDDDYEGWRQFTIPFSQFQRRTDFQPPAAPNDGLGLDSVSGYAFGLPVGVGAQVALLDMVGVTTIEGDEVIVYEGEFIPTITGRPVYDLEAENLWNEREWELIWSDEFEGEAGTPINTDYWTAEIGGQGWGNNEHQYYTTSPTNASLDGEGNLAIVARQENPNNYRCHYGVCRYTSARLITLGKVEFTYGRVEARIRIPYGQGIWPAFWMLGDDIRTVSWPRSGEIDIMENIGREPYIAHGTIHGPGYSGGEGITGSLRSDTRYADDFHVYAIEWEENVIRWYLDGELYHMVTPADLGGDEWVFDHDFFIILNVAVGGNWPGYPDDTTEFPQTMLVDYVRVYQLAE